MAELCDLCKEQRQKGRMDNAHEFLKLVYKKTYKEPRGIWKEYKYVCTKCGATVLHTNDKGDSPPYWSAHPEETE